MKSKQGAVGLSAFLVTLTFDDGTTRESPFFAENPYAALALAIANVDRVIKALIEPCISLTEDNHATD